MRNAAVRGVGITPFTRKTGASAEDLAADAIAEAVADAGLSPDDLDIAFVGHVKQGPAFGQRVLVRDLGRSGLPVVNVENVCASSSTAFALAFAAVSGGTAEHALVVGAEVLSGETGTLKLHAADYNEQQQIPLPVSYALKAAAYAERYDVDPVRFAGVAVKNRGNGTKNPDAVFQKAVTLDEVLASKPVAGPLTLFQCSANADGAAALVLSAVPGDRGVRVSASVLRSGHHFGSDHVGKGDVTAEAAAAAYEVAGVGPDDLDLVECHDAFSCGEVFHYESLGLCPPGEGLRLLEDGETALSGRVPVNPSGGLLSRGHPIGASGAAQIVEVVRQLRGEADARQVRNPKLGLAHTMGGGMYGIDGSAACVVTLLHA